MGAADRLALVAREVAARPDADVPSPCISVCRMNPQSELCEGCYRTIDEIMVWGSSGDDERRAMWRLIAERIAQR